jgi:hypothetical protein
LIISGVCLVLTLFVPRILMTMPVLVTVVCGLVSIFRKEKGRPLAGVIAVIAVILFVTSSMEMSKSFSNIGGTNTEDLTKAKVSDFNWRADPTFGTKGTIRWNVSVQNLSDKPMSMVGVQFSTYDKDKKLIATTRTYVSAIPPGDSRDDASFADLYGNEESATATIESVHFASQ